MTVSLEANTVPRIFTECPTDCPAVRAATESVLQEPEVTALQAERTVHNVTVVHACGPIPSAAQAVMTSRVEADLAGDGVRQTVTRLTQTVNCAGLQVTHERHAGATPNHDLLRP